MRILIALICCLLASPALAQYWSHYANARFGYEIDVPPGFSGQGESDNGDGQVFHRLKAEQSLTVWGGYFLESFEDEVAQQEGFIGADNWALTYQASTPQWAVFSGQRDHRIVYQRMIPLCDGASYAAFRLEYNVRDIGPTDEMINGLTRSLVGQRC